MKHKPNNSKFSQGWYKVKNPEKYMGKSDDIIYRSSWELHVFDFFDNNPNVIKWGSEEIMIPYMKPTPDGMKPSKYFPDIYVEYIDRQGNHIKELMEIKPLKQTKASKSKKRSNKLYENTIYLINQVKFAAAHDWCSRNGVKFTIATENDIFRT